MNQGAFYNKNSMVLLADKIPKRNGYIVSNNAVCF